MVLWLIAILCLAHVARMSASPSGQLQILSNYAFIPARYSRAFLQSRMLDPGSVLDRIIPFVSYIGLHNDFTHLGINCLWLLAFGPIVARRFGSMLFLVFFVICGVAAAGTYLACNWGSDIPVVGASGAISGLMGAALRMLPRNTPWQLMGDAPLAPILSRQMLVFSVLWVGVNLLAAFTGFGMAGESGMIAWQAHLGGYAAGVFLATPFDALRPRGVGQPLAD